MTQKNKELLLKDLCTRLPYKVYAQMPDEYGGYTSAIESIDIDGFVKDFEGEQIEIENIKPYLFPLSSMTEEQKKEYRKACELDTEVLSKHPMDGSPFPALYNSQDWLNKNHFDYRGLIEKGLAIDATGLNIY
jgi:hypothetical protein